MPEFTYLPVWTVVFGFILGAVAGSFLNMVVYRLPRQKSFFDPPHSICPICDHKLHPIDLIPLLSWLSTRGKCRYCQAPIPIRYFLIELLVAVLFSIIWLQQQVLAENTPLTIAQMAFVALLIAAFFIDWELFIIPDEINAALFFVGLVYHAAVGDLGLALGGALAGWGVIWAIAFLGRIGFGKEAMGSGDIKLMRGVGALVGPLMVGATMVFAVFAGLVIGGLLLLLNQHRKEVAASREGSADAMADVPLPPLWFLVVEGLYYLFLLDIVALFVPPFRRAVEAWANRVVPGSEALDDLDWEPDPTAIPFGPYLAAGAILCVLCAKPVESAVQSYLDYAVGPPETSRPR